MRGDFMRRTYRLVAAAVIGLMLCMPPSAAAVADHLKCYKMKDPLPKGQYTADLTGLVPEPGCTINVPGRLLCVGSEKTNVTPSPPGAPAGAPAGRFVCYKAKCPKSLLAAVTISDQFGTRAVQPSAPKLVCAPQPTVCCGSTLLSICMDQDPGTAGSGCSIYGNADQVPGTVCNGATGACEPARTGVTACCQDGPSFCFEGPQSAVGCATVSGTLNPGQRCLTNGTCAP
jgi:hypothetical protein